MDSTISKKLPAVLIISKNIQHTVDLCKAIYLRSPEEKNAALSTNFEKYLADSKKEVGFLTTEYVLDTKYYNCEIRIICCSYEFLLGFTTEENLESKWEAHGVSSVEALVFTANLLDNNREGIDEYVKYHNDLIEKLNPNLMMCFANKRKAENLDLNKVLGFSDEDYLIEIVDDDLESIKKISQGEQAGNTEKYGVERIIENLQCHMWPNMQKKQVQTKGIAKVDLMSQQVFGNDEEDDDDDDEPETKEPSKDTKKEEKQAEKSEPKKEEPKSSSNQTSSNTKKETKQASDNVTDIYKQILEYADEDEKEMEELSNIFQSIQQFRMTSKDLPDKDRKDQAANLIMKLVNNCKEFQNEDDDDDEDDWQPTEQAKVEESQGKSTESK